FRWNGGFEQSLLNESGAGQSILGLALAFTEAICVRKWNMSHARQQRRKPATLLRLRCRQREGAHGTSVKGAVEGNYALPFGVIASQLQRALDGFGSRVPKIELVGTRHGRDLAQAIGQLGHRFVVKVGAGHVNQLASLPLNGSNDFRMTMSSGGYGDAGRKVEELVAVNVLDDGAASAFDDQRIRTRVAGRDQALVFGNNSLCIGTGKRPLDFGQSGLRLCRTGHSFSCHGNFSSQRRARR